MATAALPIRGSHRPEQSTVRVAGITTLTLTDPATTRRGRVDENEEGGERSDMEDR
jgi:hypothetical protein